MTDWAALLSGFEWVVALLFILGIILVIFEVIMPGIGFIGGTGVVLLIVGTIGASQIVSPPVLVAIIAGVLLIVVGMLVWVYRSATRGGRISKTLVLKTTEGKEQGYLGFDEPVELVGMEGIALTHLRPTGTGEFGSRRMDVVTEGEFIPKDTKIKIIEIKGYRTVVIKI